MYPKFYERSRGPENVHGAPFKPSLESFAGQSGALPGAHISSGQRAGAGCWSLAVQRRLGLSATEFTTHHVHSPTLVVDTAIEAWAYVVSADLGRPKADEPGRAQC